MIGIGLFDIFYILYCIIFSFFMLYYMTNRKIKIYKLFHTILNHSTVIIFLESFVVFHCIKLIKLCEIEWKYIVMYVVHFYRFDFVFIPPFFSV